jgi:hypothetical protein
MPAFDIVPKTELAEVDNSLAGIARADALITVLAE